MPAEAIIRWSRRLLAILSVMVLLHAASPALAAEAVVIELDPQVGVAPLAGKYTWYEDKTGQLTIDDVSRPELADRFLLSSGDNLSLGYTSSAIWLRFRLGGTRPDADRWLLNFDYALLDRIEVYQSMGDGTWSLQVMGDDRPFADRPIRYRTFVAELAPVDAAVNTVFVRIISKSSMVIRPSLSTATVFFERASRQQVFFGLIYGFMLMMALYNAFLSVSMKDRTYLVYVASVISGGLFIAALNGHAYQFLWPDSPRLASIALPLLSALWVVFTALFTRMFLDTRRHAPRLHRLIGIVIGLGGAAVLLALFADYRISIRFSTGLGLASAALILTTGLVSWYWGNQPARFFSLAWIVYWFGSATLILSRFGVIEDNAVTHHSAALGLLVEIIMLSLALSDKYRVMSRQLAEHTAGLERRIAERTHDLRKANRELKRLSLIDALTGLSNRREFDRVLLEEWHRHCRKSESLSLLVCDIDDFKQLNDHFGHEAGDKALRGVARVIDAAMSRAADHASRIGGDEFAVILPETDMAGAAKIADDICEEVRGLDIEHAPAGRHDVLTLSIGVACLVPDRNGHPARLYRLADEALYLAKSRGRDQAAIAV